MKKEENKPVNLQEATIKALYNQLENDNVQDVEGIIDDVLVITDPEITKDEYDEVIERAQEIIEDTPEGDIPFDEEYLGQYLQTCPICGTSFVEDHLLEPGSICPICLEQPEAFVVIGKVEGEDEVAEDFGITDEDDVDISSESSIDVKEYVPETGMEQPTEETDDLPERSGGRRVSNINKEVASKEVPQGNKLAESKLDETGARDIADSINNSEWYNNDIRKQTLRGMLADKIADVAEELGDDYSEWISDLDFDDIIEEVTNSSEWSNFNTKLDEIIKEKVIDKVEWTRRDDPASKYYAGDLSELEEGKLVEAPTKGSPEYEKLCVEIEYQADDNSFTLTEEDIEGIADKMIADNFFFNHDIFADDNDLDAWEEINSLIIEAIESYPNKVEEAKSDKKATEYELVEAGDSKIDELEKGSAFTILGLDTSDASMDGLISALKEGLGEENINFPIKCYRWSGETMNSKYGLTGENAYPNDLNIVAIDLNTFKDIGRLAIFRLGTRAKWLDDIVANNRIEEENNEEE